MTRVTYANIAQDIMNVTATHRRTSHTVDHDVHDNIFRTACTCGQSFYTSEIYVAPVSAQSPYNVHTAEVIAHISGMTPDTIGTTDALHQLPSGSIIRDANGTMMQYTYNKYHPDYVSWFTQDGDALASDNVALPAQIWWTP